MTIKKREVVMLTGTSHVGAGAVSGEARAYIGLGSKYGLVHGFEFKGDDANVDTNNTVALSDSRGRTIFAATALDGGDTTSDEFTEQTRAIGATVSAASTVGVYTRLTPLETTVYDVNGDPEANTEGPPGGMFAESPVLVTLASGTDGDYHRVILWVEV